MNAGSSPDIGKSGIKGFVIPITEPPVVEIDTEATDGVLNQTRYVAVETLYKKSKKSIYLAGQTG
jgi:hypothetical protein